MRIGLLRHFKVDCPHEKMMTSEEFRKWSEKYENSGIIKKKVEMYGINWDSCYSSDISRAVDTAKEVYNGKIYVDKRLREVDNEPFIHTKRIRLPFGVWHVCGRLAWYFKAKSQPESIVGTRRRIRSFLNSIDWSEDDILIVGHGFLIFNLCFELLRMGFRGKKLYHVENGVVYLYEGPKPPCGRGRQKNYRKIGRQGK